MSTCRGCWTDGLGNVPGIVMHVLGAPDLVWHLPHPDCREPTPHVRTNCGMFPPVREWLTHDHCGVICRLFNATGVSCPDESCDLEDGVRALPDLSAEPFDPPPLR